MAKLNYGMRYSNGAGDPDAWGFVDRGFKARGGPVKRLSRTEIAKAYPHLSLAPTMEERRARVEAVFAKFAGNAQKPLAQAGLPRLIRALDRREAVFERFASRP